MVTFGDITKEGSFWGGVEGERNGLSIPPLDFCCQRKRATIKSWFGLTENRKEWWIKLEGYVALQCECKHPPSAYNCQNSEEGTDLFRATINPGSDSHVGWYNDWQYQDCGPCPPTQDTDQESEDPACSCPEYGWEGAEAQVKTNVDAGYGIECGYLQISMPRTVVGPYGGDMDGVVEAVKAASELLAGNGLDIIGNCEPCK